MEFKIYDKYKAVIGLEIHAQLNTKSKMFSSDANGYGNTPNTDISPITLAHPGTMPSINKKAIEYAISMGLACNASINMFNVFARKNYFYPDLPKGYQITQDKTPICYSGHIDIEDDNGNYKSIKIKRIHLEEDTGKSIHNLELNATLLDFNRAGIPLIEIVTEPDIATPHEAYEFISEIRNMLRYLDICNGNMEEGSLRCDTNISVMSINSNVLGNKVEVKNINSMRGVKMSIEYEIKRQVDLLELGGVVDSETRNYDAANNVTVKQRVKDTMSDYRYFPDPNLSPVLISDNWLKTISDNIPILPQQLRHKFINDYGLSKYDAQVLVNSKDIAIFFDNLCSKTHYYKIAANWVIGPIKFYLNELKVNINDFPISVNNLIALINMIGSGEINFSLALHKLYPAMLQNANDEPKAIAERMGIVGNNLSNEELRKLILSIMEQYPEQVKEYHNGKKGIASMFMGELMRKTGRKVNPRDASALIEEMLLSNSN